MRGLKALVIGMGVLIVAGFAALVWGIADQAGRLGADPEAGAPPSPPPQETPVGGAVAAVTLPPGAEIRETRLDGDRILVRLALPGGAARLLVLDARSGRTEAAIDLAPAGRP